MAVNKLARKETNSKKKNALYKLKNYLAARAVKHGEAKQMNQSVSEVPWHHHSANVRIKFSVNKSVHIPPGKLEQFIQFYNL